MRSYDTIGGLIEGRFTLHVYCHRSTCQHHAKIDLEMLAEKLGREHSCVHDDLAHKFVCSKCGGKKLGLIVAPYTGTQIAYNPSGWK